MRVKTDAMQRRYDYAAELTLCYNVFLLTLNARTAT